MPLYFDYMITTSKKHTKLFSIIVFLFLVLAQNQSFAQKVTIHFNQPLYLTEGAQEATISAVYHDGIRWWKQTEYKIVTGQSTFEWDLDLGLEHSTEVVLSLDHCKTKFKLGLWLSPKDNVTVHAHDEIVCNKRPCAPEFFNKRYIIEGKNADFHKKYAYYHYLNDRDYGSQNNPYYIGYSSPAHDKKAPTLAHIDQKLALRLDSINTHLPGKNNTKLRLLLRDKERYHAATSILNEVGPNATIARSERLDSGEVAELIKKYHLLESGEEFLWEFVNFAYELPLFQKGSRRYGYRDRSSVILDSLVENGLLDARKEIEPLYQHWLNNKNQTFYRYKDSIGDLDPALGFAFWEDEQLSLGMHKGYQSNLKYYQYLKDLKLDPRIKRYKAFKRLTNMQNNSMYLMRKPEYLSEREWNSFTLYFGLSFGKSLDRVEDIATSMCPDHRKLLNINYGALAFEWIEDDTSFHQMMEKYKGKTTVLVVFPPYSWGYQHEALAMYQNWRKLPVMKDVQFVKLIRQRKRDDSDNDVRDYVDMLYQSNELDDTYLVKTDINICFDQYFQCNAIGPFMVIDPNGHALPIEKSHLGNEFYNLRRPRLNINPHPPQEQEVVVDEDLQLGSGYAGEEYEMDVAIEEGERVYFDPPNYNRNYGRRVEEKPAWEVKEIEEKTDEHRSFSAIVSQYQSKELVSFESSNFIEQFFPKNEGWYASRGFGFTYLTKEKPRNLYAQSIWTISGDTLFTCEDDGTIKDNYSFSYNPKTFILTVSNEEYYGEYQVMMSSVRAIVLKNIKSEFKR